MSVFDDIKIAYLKKVLLYEEKKKSRRDEIRLKKEKLEDEKKKVKIMEKEILKRIKRERERGLTESDKKRLITRKEFIMKRKKEIATSLIVIGREAKDFTKFIANKIDEANKDKQRRFELERKALSKKKKKSHKKKKKK